MTRVLFIAYYFPPIGGSPVQRTLKFVQYLPAEGFIPTVITGSTAGKDRWAPRDESLLGLVPTEVDVHRADQSAVSRPSKLRSRLERWLTLRSDFGKWWIKSVVDLGCRFGREAGVIFATMSPYESGEAASALSKRLGIPWVADLRDPWALDDTQVCPSLLHRRAEMSRMERVLSTASLIIMNTHAAGAALKDAFPSLHGPILTITNGFDGEDLLHNVAPRTDAKFRIAHSGGMLTDTGMQLRQRKFYRLLGGVEPGVDILTRSPKILLEAVDRWCARRPEIRNDIDIVFAGNTTEMDRNVAYSSNVSDIVRFPGYLTHDDSLSLIRTADLLFLPMHNLPPGTPCRSIPGKAFEYMASGRPILAAIPDGDAREFLSQCGTGLICRPDDVEGMVRILDLVYSSWKTGQPIASSNTEYVRQFDRRILTRTLAAGLTQVVRPIPLAERENTGKIPLGASTSA
jgi:glycosyltransferase involved in cell wall biosynthesis